MHLIHSSRIPSTYIDELDRFFRGLRRIAIPPCNTVYDSISTHPDIFLFQLDKKTLIYSQNICRTVMDALRKTSVRLIHSQSIPLGTYPGTAPLNAARVGDFIFHNLIYTDMVIKSEAETRGLKMVHTNQGYSRCSTIPVGKNALITQDQGIKESACDLKLDVEIISAGNVELPGQKYGFIGGTTGVTPDGRVVFLGDIKSQQDFQLIDNFLKKHGTDYIHIPNLPLFDAGSLIFLDTD